MLDKIKGLFNKNKETDKFDEELEDDTDDFELDEDSDDLEDEDINEDSEDSFDEDDYDFDENGDDDFDEDSEFDDDFSNTKSTSEDKFSKLKENLKENKKTLAIGSGVILVSIIGYVVSPFFFNSVDEDEDLEDYSYTEPKTIKKKSTLKKKSIKKRQNTTVKKTDRKTKTTKKPIRKRKVTTVKKTDKESGLEKKYKEFKKANPVKKTTVATYDFNKKDPKETIITGNRKLLKKIENSNVVPQKNDVIDPFAQEFETTLKMKQMQNALKESKKLMKEYTDFKLLQLAFEKTKNEYENNKMKNKYQTELNLVKSEFASKLKEMNQALSNIQVQNNSLNNKIQNNAQTIQSVSEIKTDNSNTINKRVMPKVDDESLFNENITSKQVYKIGSTYLLEETDEFGRVKIYRKGNVYNRMKIMDISPDFLKVKTNKGTTKILTINQNSSNAIGVYYHTTIKTGMKSSVENEKVEEKNAVEIKTYGNTLQDRKEEETTNSLKSFNSRF